MDVLVDFLRHREPTPFVKAVVSLAENAAATTTAVVSLAKNAAATSTAVAPDVQVRLDALTRSVESNQQQLSSMEQKLDAVLTALAK